MANMRVTTGMAMNSYRFNLQNSTYNLTNSRNKVLSHRQFDTFAENPIAAAQAWKIRRAMVDISNYQANNSDTYSRFNIAWATMGMIKTNLETDADAADIRARQDSTAAARVDLGRILSNTADSLIQAMNSAKFGDHFVFSGDDEMNPPFTWSNDGKTLYYRGIDVNSGGVRKPTEMPDWADPENSLTNLSEDTPVKGRNQVEQAWVDYCENQKAWNDYNKNKAEWDAYEANKSAWDEYDQKMTEWKLGGEEGDPPEKPEGVRINKPDTEKMDPPAGPLPKPSDAYATDPFEGVAKDEFGVPVTAYDLKDSEDDNTRLWAEYYLDQGNKNRLDMLAAEYENVDLGMGLKEDAGGKLINGTAFDRSLPGINMLGYGMDEDGDPVNIAMIMKRLGEIYSNCDPTTGRFSDDVDENRRLEAEADRLLDKFQAATDRTNASYVDIETKAHYLQQNESRLKLQGDYLQEERANIENVDLADAITQFSWDYYCYSAALKVGTQLLSQSLIDYMN